MYSVESLSVYSVESVRQRVQRPRSDITCLNSMKSLMMLYCCIYLNIFSYFLQFEYVNLAVEEVGDIDAELISG